MPRGDGTGPAGGRGFGRGQRKRGGSGTGPGGFCVCPSCGHKEPHQAGVPCSTISCPKCDVPMMRE